MAIEFQKGLEHFNRQEFFEAHEAWEKLWLKAGKEKRFLQGLIQIAAGYHHYMHENKEGAILFLRRGSDYLSAYPEKHMGIYSGKLIKDALTSAEEIEKQCLRSLPRITKT